MFELYNVFIKTKNAIIIYLTFCFHQSSACAQEDVWKGKSHIYDWRYSLWKCKYFFLSSGIVYLVYDKKQDYIFLPMMASLNVYLWSWLNRKFQDVTVFVQTVDLMGLVHWDFIQNCLAWFVRFSNFLSLCKLEIPHTP